VTRFDARDVTHRFPEFLPDGRHFLFLASPNGGEDPANAICVGSLDGNLRKPLLSAADEPHYVDGAIVFAHDRVLTAQRFDPKKLALLGEAVPLKEQEVQTTPLFARSVVSIAGGNILYQPGSSPRESRLAWFDRTGKEIGSVGGNDRYATVNLSPDSRFVAVSYGWTAQSNIWMFDLVRGGKTRVTFGNEMDMGPLWSPDGRKLVYTTLNEGKIRMRLKDLASGAEEELFKSDAIGTPVPTSWSRDGSAIFFSNGGLMTRSDIFWFSLTDHQQHVYLNTPFVEATPRVSPDGKWVAYQSNESSGNDVYLAPFPPTGAKWQVSTSGGVVPRWRGDGKELFFALPGPTVGMMAVPITLGATPQIGQPVKLFDFHIGLPGPSMYDVTPDGQRFLINTRIGDEPPPEPLVLVQHFDSELRAAVENRH
jgi:hypothetical protein